MFWYNDADNDDDDVNDDDDDDLTPGRNGGLDDEAGDVGVEDLDKLEVLQDGLDHHPGEGYEDEVMEESSHTDAHHIIVSLLNTHQEDDVDC